MTEHADKNSSNHEYAFRIPFRSSNVPVFYDSMIDPVAIRSLSHSATTLLFAFFVAAALYADIALN